MRKPNTQIFHIRESIRLGKEIHNLIDKNKLNSKELVQSFKEGLSGSELVTKFKLTKKLHVANNFAKHGVLSALKGYDGSKLGSGDAYAGLIPLDEYKTIAAEHAQKSREKVGASNLKRRVGIHAQTDSERINTVKSALRARGITPHEDMVLLSDLDRLIIECCMNHPYFRAGQFGGAKRVTEHLNAVVPSRTIKIVTVRAVMNKIKRRSS